MSINRINMEERAYAMFCFSLETFPTSVVGSGSFCLCARFLSFLNNTSSSGTLCVVINIKSQSDVAVAVPYTLLRVRQTTSAYQILIKTKPATPNIKVESPFSDFGVMVSFQPQKGPLETWFLHKETARKTASV